jgi:hypothetical protein
MQPTTAMQICIHDKSVGTPGWKLESLCPGAYAVSVCTLLDVQNASRFRSTARRLQGPSHGWECGTMARQT